MAPPRKAGVSGFAGCWPLPAMGDTCPFPAEEGWAGPLDRASPEPICGTLGPSPTGNTLHRSIGTQPRGSNGSRRAWHQHASPTGPCSLKAGPVRAVLPTPGGEVSVPGSDYLSEVQRGCLLGGRGVPRCSAHPMPLLDRTHPALCGTPLNSWGDWGAGLAGRSEASDTLLTSYEDRWVPGHPVS